MKALLIATAVIEAGAGLGLLCVPSAAAVLLLGAALDTPTALTAARVGGLGLLTLGVACWLARDDGQSPAARGLANAMVIYNAGAAGVLVYANIGLGLHGVALWPVVALHTVMTVWCLARWAAKR